MDDARTTEGFMSMKGGGYYSKATIGAKHVIDNAAHLIFDSLVRMNPKDDGTTFTVADMGCADGGTSISTIGEILKYIRKTAPSRPIQMVYTDLPKNDFSQVFQNVHGQTDMKTYIADIEDLYIFSSATSFHKPIFPAGSLNLGISATASHYVSEQPCIISNHVHMVGSAGEERAAYQEQGRLDWEKMLLNRARDLAPTGRLALFNFGIDEKGRLLVGLADDPAESSIVAEGNSNSGTSYAVLDLRRGSAACYLQIDHPEIEEFIEMRRPTGGDVNRRSLNLHHGVLVTDDFMRAVETDGQWALRSPYDGTVQSTLPARNLWIRLLTARVETGEPYIIYIDTVNRQIPQHHKLAGLTVKTSNLCSEITLPTGKDRDGNERTAVCLSLIHI